MTAAADESQGKTIRRIVVALDASPSSLDALEAAVRLAAHLRAEIEGVFVEDENLHRFAALPFTRVIDPLSARARAYEPADSLRELEIHAARARRALARIAGAHVAWRFRVLRGDVERMLFAAAREADLLSLGFRLRKGATAAWTGRIARRAALAAPGAVLLLARSLEAGAPVVALIDSAGVRSARVIAQAARLAEALGGPLTVISGAGGDAARTRRIEKLVAATVEGTGVEVRTHHAVGVERALAEARARAAGGVLAVGGGTRGAGRATLERLVESCRCSLLVIR